MLVAIFILKLLAAIAAIRNKLKVIGNFLIFNLLFDILTQILMVIMKPYPKPYTGFGFFLLSIAVFGYLANGANLLYHSGVALDNKTLKQTSILSLLSILGLVLFVYPIPLASLYLLYYIYYAVISIVSLVFLVKNLRQHLSFSFRLYCGTNYGSFAESSVSVCVCLQLHFLSCNSWRLRINSEI